MKPTELLYRITDAMTGVPVGEVDTFRAAKRLIMKHGAGKLYRVEQVHQPKQQWIFSAEEIPEDEP